MSNRKLNPGTVEPFNSYDKDLDVIIGNVQIRVDHDDVDHKESESVAYLIAAAPELLEALRAILDVPGLVDGLPLHVFDTAQTAIAKATKEG